MVSPELLNLKLEHQSHLPVSAPVRFIPGWEGRLAVPRLDSSLHQVALVPGWAGATHGSGGVTRRHLQFRRYYRNLPLLLLLRGGISTWLFGDSTDHVIAYTLISVFGEMSHQSQPRGILLREF
jgi:hypothetical protein